MTSTEQQEESRSPAISVVMPMYKEALPILSRTIDSILGQTFSDIELIAVVDDPLYTQAISLLQAYSSRDPRFRYVVNERNLGVWPSYNRGIRLTKGDYIAIQDADDRSHPERLEKQYEFLQRNPGVDVVGASLEYVDERSQAVLMTRTYPMTVENAIKRYCPIAHGTTLRKRGLHERYGFYDESDSVRHAADYELWCRWHAQGVKLVNISEVVYSYYQHSSSFKSQNVRSILEDTVRVKKRYAASLEFGIFDYIRLGSERIVALLPGAMIKALFFQYARRRCRRAPDRHRSELGAVG
jgi:glycosyltransferase involved in cell wall biosynthesis